MAAGSLPPRTEQSGSHGDIGPTPLILETRFETAEGVATLVDFMPGHQAGSSIVRLIVGERGRIAMRTEFVIRFGYGATVPWMTKLDDGTRRAIAGPDMVLLRTADTAARQESQNRSANLP